MEEYLEFAKQIAFRAGEIMVRYFVTGDKGHLKQDQTLVTKADEEINQLVLSEVAKKYPEHAVFGEEASSKNTSKLLWSCDPVDGTHQFAKGLQVAVFSLAFVEDGEPKMGVVYDPFTKRLYWATVGNGAYLNDSQIRVSKQKLDFYATVDVEWWPEAPYNLGVAMLTIANETQCYPLAIGSTIQAAMRVAVGDYEACLFAGTKGKSVDMAAVKVIVEEAGGKVTDIFGENQRYDGDIRGAVVSNGLVHKKLLGYLKF